MPFATINTKVGNGPLMTCYPHPKKIEETPVSIIETETGVLTMKTISALGLAGGFLLLGRGLVSAVVVLWVASRVSHALALALFKEALRAGWFDAER